MIRLRSFCAAAACITLASLSMAGEQPGPFNGTWVGVVNLPNGEKLPFIAHLKQQGDSVSGVLDGINGAPDVPIQGAMISHETLTFTGVRLINKQNVTFTYTVKPTSHGDLHFSFIREGGQPLQSTTHRLTAMP